MPLHRFYYAPGIFSAQDKKEIAQRITKIYTDFGLPAFYVDVIFLEVPVDSIYIGGEPAPKFVRVVSQHLARTMPTYERKQRAVNGLEEAFRPYVKDRGLDWEIHIEEVPRDTWHLNGLVPPMPNTDAEKEWFKENRAVPY
ncbi:hypothetical protein INT43_005419 [Umbelopsis isabellina]|uniref:Tautomerase cis-CaaD-like domain-containing protein n=1 Tax=Mortierella isabellina TaxID=91625 RepID=A0A8H7PLZ3_MORIS|nr:hypothetical protein INT43_005419 [Umbelopsis isabellina]